MPETPSETNEALIFSKCWSVETDKPLWEQCSSDGMQEAGIHSQH